MTRSCCLRSGSLGFETDFSPGDQGDEAETSKKETAKPDPKKVDADDKANDGDGAGESSEDKKWRTLAERTVASFCELIAEPESEQKLTEILAKCGARSVQGHPGQDCVAVAFDPKLMGEPVTAPHIRTTPLGKPQKKRLTKLLGAVVKSRLSDSSVDASLLEGDVLMTLDAGKAGLTNKVAAVGRQVCGGAKLQKKSVTVATSEESLCSRKCRVRGVAALSQTEQLTFFANQTFTVPDKPRKFYQGTNRGSLIAFVKLPKWEAAETWKCTFDDKKAMYGKLRVAVGGKSTDDKDKSDGSSDDIDETTEVVVPPSVDASGNLYMPKARHGCNLEPVAFWSMPLTFYKELLTSYNIMAMYDLTAGDGNTAKACIALRRPQTDCI